MVNGNGLGKLREDEILRFMRFTVTESAAATFTQQEYSTNLSLERGVIWQIHFVEAMVNPALIEVPAANTVEEFVGQITRESKSALLNINDADLIAIFRREVKRSAAIGTDAGPLWWVSDGVMRVDFPIPVLYAGASIYAGILTTNASVQTFRGRIGYTLAKADEKLFFRVAQALIG